MHVLNEKLAAAPVVPVVVLEDADKAVPLAEALVAGGLPVIEVTMRTAAAPAAISAIAREVPEAIIGAGTVLNAAQANTILDAGAQFLVSPGLDDGVVGTAADRGVPIMPGVATATEAQRAWNLGLRTVKFFPAGQAGGVPMLKALSSVFRDLSFMPTGGVSSTNLAEYLLLPQVLACGGSWLTPADAVAAGDWMRIEALASEAVSIASVARA
ncbi:MAG: bifunctional 4-hydroxy-2-oxoglutarate aldolase/2-dehydro-3-deoxy-phosphogluconate aldolase [Pseudomonadota bacterium]